MTREEALLWLKKVKEFLSEFRGFSSVDGGMAIAACEALMQPCGCEALKKERDILAGELAAGHECPAYSTENTQDARCMHISKDCSPGFPDATHEQRKQCWLEWARMKARDGT